MPPAHDPATGLIVIAVILGVFGVLIAMAVRAAKQRPAKHARLREAPTVAAYSVSTSRILVVLLVGTIIAAGSAPVLMALSPKTPLLFLVSIGLAFAAVLAPLTFARDLTVDRRLVLEGRLLRFEQRGVSPVVIDLARDFSVEAHPVDDETLVLVQQAAARVLFSYRKGPAFVTLPLTELPPGWVRDDERFTLFGDEAAIIYERIRGG
jgi:hypothetical protein